MTLIPSLLCFSKNALHCWSLYCHQHSYSVILSLRSGNFHHTLKESVVSSLRKKRTLDKDELSNYRPIPNLSLLSKIIERVVKSRLSVFFLRLPTHASNLSFTLLTSLRVVDYPLVFHCTLNKYTVCILTRPIVQSGPIKSKLLWASVLCFWASVHGLPKSLYQNSPMSLNHDDNKSHFPTLRSPCSNQFFTQDHDVCHALSP